MSYALYANAICHKVQEAAKAMLQAAIVAGDLDVVDSSAIFSGIEPADLTATRVVCICKQAVVEEFYDGNWSAELVVRVSAPAADYASQDDFHEVCGGVFAQFFQLPEGVCASLSNSDIAFTAQAVYPRSQAWDRDEQVWESHLVLTVKCCGSVVA